MNVVAIIGNLTRDPESRTTTTGKTVAEFTIAVNRLSQENERDANFFRVKAWGQSAEFITTYGKKGLKVAVSGRLEQRKYTDSNGVNREVVEIIADRVQILDKKETSDTPSAPAANAALTPPADEWDPFESE